MDFHHLSRNTSLYRARARRCIDEGCTKHEVDCRLATNVRFVDITTHNELTLHSCCFDLLVGLILILFD